MADKKQKRILTDDEINYPEVDISTLYKKIPNRFLLSVAISKRARQLAEGERPLVDFVPGKPFNPVALAIKELDEGLIRVSIKEEVDEELELLDKLDKGLKDKLEKVEEDLQKDKEKEKKPRSKSLSAS